jgi:hypothetical protein
MASFVRSAAVNPNDLKQGMIMRRFLTVLATLAVVSGPAFAATGPFAGTWKLNVAKSKFTGETVTYTKTAQGFRYSNGSTVAYDFKMDGKDYPTGIPGRTMAWSPAPGGGYDTVAKNDGKVLSKTHRSFSADGKAMMASYTEYRADGTVVHEGDTFRRLTGATGLAGKWGDVKAQAVSSDLVIATPAAGRFEITYPSDKETVAGTLDGAPAPITGPTVPPGVMASYKGGSGSAWSYEVTLQGKTYEKGVLTLSDGGKTLTDKGWTPGKEAEAGTSVYDRQ